MAVLVVDASAIASVLFGEPAAERIVPRLRGAELVAPWLLSFELANICLKKGRKRPEQHVALAQALRMRGRFGIKEAGVDQDETVQLAVATGLTAYDAAYLWLARRLGAELVTLDEQLARACA